MRMRDGEKLYEEEAMKKAIIPIIILITSIIIIIFIKNNYKIENLGNNITNKQISNVQEYILNMNSYNTEAKVTVKSNKNENTYKIKQQYTDGVYRQEVLEPEGLRGTIISYNGESLILENTKLNFSKIYENYKYITNNSLCLNHFVEEFKMSENTSINETENEVIFEIIPNNKNRYIVKKVLYVDKKTGNPTKLEVQDSTQNIVVNILYNEIKIRT